VALKEFSAPASHNPAALGGQADMPTRENFFQPADAKIAASVSQVFALVDDGRLPQRVNYLEPFRF